MPGGQPRWRFIADRVYRTALGLSLLAVRRWRLVALVKLTAARRRGAHRRRSAVGYVIHWRAARDEPAMARKYV